MRSELIDVKWSFNSLEIVKVSELNMLQLVELDGDEIADFRAFHSVEGWDFFKTRRWKYSLFALR